MNSKIKLVMDMAVAEIITDIPNLVDKEVRQVIVNEICTQLNLRYSFNEYKHNPLENRSMFSMEIRDYVRNQFSGVMQKNIDELLPKRDMNQIMREARKSVDEAIKLEFQKLWKEELKEIAEREAKKLFEEVKKSLEFE